MSILRGFFTSAVLSVAMVNAFVGTLNGYIIGYVGVYDTLHRGNENCTQLTTQEACGSVSFTKCRWEASQCIFTDEPACGLQSGEDNCKARKACFFDYESGTCLHKTGWDSVLLGVFAAAMTLGGMIGSFAAAPIVRVFGRKWPITFSGAGALLATIILHIGRATDIYALAIVGRILVGAAMGVCSVAGPMYVEEMAPDEYRGPLGAFFQIFTTFGIFLAAAMGLIVEPHDMAAKQNNEVRIQMLIMVQSVLAAVTMAMGLMMKHSNKIDPEGSMLFGRNQIAAPEHSSSSVAELQGDLKLPRTKAYPLTRMIPQLLIATMCCVALQFTGINAIMNYAPSITKSMGLRPLMGNFLVMLWNFVSTLIVLPATRFVNTRWLFLIGIAGAFVSQFLAAIVIYPGVVGDDKARAGISGLGIFAFIFFFEFGIGPAFYVLCVRLFPLSFRPRGAGFAQAVQYLFNIIINVCFPIAVVEISGGPSSNQNKGMSAVFFFFSGCAAVAFVVHFFFLYPFEEEAPQDAANEPIADNNGGSSSTDGNGPTVPATEAV